jgi:hypothetical protein
VTITQLAFPRQTPRLVLHPLVADDRESIHRLYSDWRVARWLSRLPWPFTPESAETLIAEAVSDVDRGGGLFLALRHRTTGEIVGTVSLRFPPSTRIRGPTINGWASSATPSRPNRTSRYPLSGTLEPSGLSGGVMTLTTADERAFSPTSSVADPASSASARPCKMDRYGSARAPSCSGVPGSSQGRCR